MKIKQTLLLVWMVLGIQMIPVADAAVIERSRTISSVSDDTVGFGSVSEANTSFKFTINADNVKAELTTSQLQNWTIDDQFNDECGGQAFFTSQAISESILPGDLFTISIDGTYTKCEGVGEGPGGAATFKYTLVHDGKEAVIEPAEKYVCVGVEVTLTAKDKDSGNTVGENMTWTFKDDEGNQIGTSEEGTTVTFSSNNPGIYTVSAVPTGSGSGYTYIEDAIVFVIKLELNSISGQNQNGHAKVLGKITPSVTVDSWSTLINGTEKSSGSTGFTGGNFFFWIDQGWLLYGDNTVTFEIIVDDATCSGSFTANLESKSKSKSDLLGGVLLCEGMGLTRWVNRKYSVFYDKVTYSITASGKVRHVKYADVFVDWRHFPLGETPIIPHENLYNNTASDDHFIQDMGAPNPPVILPPRTNLRQARTYKWTEPAGLKAKAKCIHYLLEACPATPVLNSKVEVAIND